MESVFVNLRLTYISGLLVDKDYGIIIGELR